MNGVYTEPYACLQSDKCFGRKFNLERHMENIHGEEDSDMNEADENSDSVEEVDDETSGEDSSDLEDNAAYQDWMAEARETQRGMTDEKYDKYVNEGMDEDQARQKVNRKTLWAVKQDFFDNYKEFLSSYLYLRENETHKDIVDDLDGKLDKGMNVNKALNRVLPKHAEKFAGLFHDEEEHA